MEEPIDMDLKSKFIMKIDRFCLLVCLLLLISYSVSGQTGLSLVEGQVTYITGESIYVKFSKTDGIEKGDTLFIKNQGLLKPVLLVQHKSSVSCLGHYLNDITVRINDTIYAKIDLDLQPHVMDENILPEGEVDLSQQTLLKEAVEPGKNIFTENIQGRLSASLYSGLNQNSELNSHRLRYTLSMDAMNISDSRISVESYISFSHKIKEWDVVQENIFNALKVYNLALRYDLNEGSKVWIGRRINPKIANVGAIDGLQYHQTFNHFYTGLVAGTRPDYRDYSFNAGLFEYGAYIGHDHKFNGGFAQSSLAFFEQRNHSKIDRRFLYIQHSNMLAKNLNLFSSSEIELYKLENGVPTNNLSLTSLYLSMGLKITKGISVFGSYDTRKNVIYYETFKNYADQILEQAYRQGLRFRINLRPFKYLSFSANAGSRFSETDARKTKTLNLSATYSRLPLLNASFNITANLMQTNYLDGNIFGLRLSKDLIPGKLYSMLQYRYVHFNYINTNTELIEHIAEIDLSYQLSKSLYFSCNIESTIEDVQNLYRVYLNIRLKF